MKKRNILFLEASYQLLFLCTFSKTWEYFTAQHKCNATTPSRNAVITLVYRCRTKVTYSDHLAQEESMVPGKSISNTQSVRGPLGEVILHLRQVQSAVVVAVAALRRQNCELDEDIAAVLQRSVADPIHDQIEHLETLMH